MKLLLDFNLSPRLIPLLAELFPGSTHLKLLGFDGETEDEKIWTFARENGFALLTSDADFLRISKQRGDPPKLIRLEKMNYRTRFAAELLRRNAIRIAEFGLSDEPVLILRAR